MNCSVGCCDRKSTYNGYCLAHYQRWNRGAELNVPIKPKNRKRTLRAICSVDGCDVIVRTIKSGMCNAHLFRSRKGLDLAPPIRERQKKPQDTCTISGCSGQHKSRGLCQMHYLRKKKGLTMQAEPLRGRAGTGCTTKSGYRVLWKPTPDKKGSSFMEHRSVMEAVIGRELMEHENVHHKNGMRDDNRPENLELWSSSQPPGQRVSDKITWMKWFLASYGYQIIDPETGTID